MRNLVIIFFLIPNVVFAEYRVFELQLTNEQKGTQTKVVSTLDHIQYPMYYPVGPGERVDYVTSWMCFENTANKEFCSNPNLAPEDGE